MKARIEGERKKNAVWQATLHVANSANGEKYLYYIGPIKKVEQSEESDTFTTQLDIKEEPSTTASGTNPVSDIQEGPSDERVPQNTIGVNHTESEEGECLSVNMNHCGEIYYYKLETDGETW